MKTKVYQLSEQINNTASILEEVEAAARSASLSAKESLRVRLLTEELLGMLPELLSYCDGKIWITNQKKVFEIHAEVTAVNQSKEVEERLISVSKSGKNAAKEGFMGKVYSVVDGLFTALHKENDNIEELQGEAWSLKQYRYELEQTDENDDLAKWDGLEKSIVASLADDVIVKIVKKNVEIIIVKDFTDTTSASDEEFRMSPLKIDIEERGEKKLNGEKKIFLKDIHIVVEPNQMVLILGGSGAGKTTFVNAVTGYEKAVAVIQKGTMDVYKDYEHMKHRIAFAPQQDLLRDEDSVYHTLANAAYMRMPANTKKADREKRIDEILEMFGLAKEKNSLVKKLSGGQRKRLSIGVEYISNPVIFFLDEPDSGLDGIMARSLMENLHHMLEGYRQIFIISHSPDRVIDLFDRVIVLAKSQKSGSGQLAFFGSPDEAKAFFGVDSMEGIVKVINRPDEGGEGRADEMIEKFAEYRKEGTVNG